jgi:hypothetical protein
MDSMFRKFCPKNKTCKEKCEECALATNKENNGGNDNLQHEINKAYLKSIGRVCLCAECADI